MVRVLNSILSGVRITSDYFRHDGDTALIRVKEIGIPPDPAILKTLNVQWETEVS
jgi:hypothetical protein